MHIMHFQFIEMGVGWIPHLPVMISEQSPTLYIIITHKLWQALGKLWLILWNV